MHRRRLASTLVGVLLTLGFVVAVPDAALGDTHPVNGPCNTTYQNTQAGAILTHAATGGEIKIETWNPSLCNTVDSPALNGAFSWVGVQVGGSASSIVQIGVGKCRYSAYPMCDGGYHVFYAWGRDAGVGSCTSTSAAIPHSLGSVPSGSHTYTVFRTGSTVTFQLDGSTIESISASNVSCWNGNSVSYGGEVWDHGDQMGGSFGDHQSFTAAIYQATAGGIWVSPNFSSCNILNNDPSIYACSRVSGNAIDIWTDRG
jgi:hypothetical protein